MSAGGRVPAGRVTPAAVRTVAAAGDEERRDLLAVEEPLEIRVAVEERGRWRRHPVAITMRTPGDDFELAAGFLFSEGVLAGPAAIAGIAYCDDGPPEAARNIVEVRLAPGTAFDPARFSRNVYTTSSCGVCGRASLELVRAALPPPVRPAPGPQLAAELVRSLPPRLAAAQTVFAATGGLHAAALFDGDGELELVREDVGRHNAVDKLVGALLADGRLPAADRLLLVSGRASFELVQKAVLAGIPVLAAVGAPSSLAVELAAEPGMTLIGFLRDGRFNLYAGAERLRPSG